MRTFDRQGVHIDRCDGCQGIFLDRGELERIADGEQRHYNVAPPPPDPHSPPRAGYPRRGGGYPDSPGGYRGGYNDSPRGYRDSPRPYRGRRKGFLEQLFD